MKIKIISEVRVNGQIIRPTDKNPTCEVSRPFAKNLIRRKLAVQIMPEPIAKTEAPTNRKVTLAEGKKPQPVKEPVNLPEPKTQEVQNIEELDPLEDDETEEIIEEEIEEVQIPAKQKTSKESKKKK